MRKIIKRALALLMITSLSASFAGCKVQYIEDETTTESVSEETTASVSETITLNLWYADEAFEAYLVSCAEDYEAANTDVKINLKYVSEQNYVEELTDAVFSGKEALDIYLITNDLLGEVKMAGITSTNTMADIYNQYNYSESAIAACTYDNKLLAYPLSFNTSFLVYNKDYVDFDTSTVCIDDIKEYADTADFSLTGNIESIFRCDLSDIFYNYGFLGGVLKIGGKNGDHKQEMFEITGALNDAVDEYCNMVEFFYIDIDNVDYYDCIRGFENGTIVFTIADTEMLHRFEEDGVNFGIAPFPDFNEEIPTSPLSVTTTAVVNPYSKNSGLAESFVKYITYTNADKLYELTSEVSCRDIYGDDEILSQIYASYAKSTAKLKVLYNEEFYALLEVAMHKMARGEERIEALANVVEYLGVEWEVETEEESSDNEGGYSF